MKRLSQKARRIRRIRKWDKLVHVVKWLLEHHILQDIIAFIMWLVDKRFPG